MSRIKQTTRQEVVAIFTKLDGAHHVSIWEVLPADYVGCLIMEIGALVEANEPIPETPPKRELHTYSDKAPEAPPRPPGRFERILEWDEYNEVRTAGTEGHKPLQIANDHGYPLQQVNYALLCSSYEEYENQARARHHETTTP